MRMTEILLLFFVAFLFFIGRPGEGTAQGNKLARQEEQADPSELEEENIYSVTYKVPDPSQEDVYDINWLRKASELAMKKGLPFFNVLDQKVYKRYSRKDNAELSVVEGRIEITSDPMSTDYDANEILGLDIGE